MMMLSAEVGMKAEKAQVYTVGGTWDIHVERSTEVRNVSLKTGDNV
jgi:hypothetical protein